MAFRYSCFISYRHTTEYKGRVYTQRIVEDLKAELELRVAHEVYRDTERLKGAEFYQESLATAICKSVCMVVLFWPTYFSEEHTFCAREFRAMEELERQRLLLLEDEAERQNGLIVIIALRDFALIPQEIRERRLCKNFEPYTLKSNMRRNPGFQQDVIDISKYISDRVRVFATVDTQRLPECEQFRLPAAGEILTWIHGMLWPSMPLPNRRVQP
jgi:hypothetical protein